MNTGKTLFAQLMDFLPWTTFTRIVDRYGGDHRVRTLSCAEQYRSMAFAQLTYREKPARHRDLPLGPRIETLSHGLPPAGPALDAGRCQRKARLAYPCGVGPVAHHPGEDAVRRRRTGVGPDQYRLRPGLDDHRSVPVGLSVGALPHHQGGGEDAHAARPAGQHSEFYPHLGWQAARRSCPRYALAESPEPSTSWIVATSTLPAFMCCTKPGPSSSRVPSRTSMLIASIRRRRIARPASFATRPSPWTASTPVRITPNFCGASASRTPSPARRWSSSPTTSRFRPPPSARSTKAAGRWNSSSSGSSSIFGSSSSYGTSENAVKTQIWIAVSVYVLVAIVKKRLDLDASLYTLLQILSVTLFEKMPIHQALAGDENRCNASQITNQLNLFDF